MRRGDPQRIYQAQRAGIFARLVQGERNQPAGHHQRLAAFVELVEELSSGPVLSGRSYLVREKLARPRRDGRPRAFGAGESLRYAPAIPCLQAIWPAPFSRGIHPSLVGG
jgi:hypothetical protein